jgi:hypothetical protein
MIEKLGSLLFDLYFHGHGLSKIACAFTGTPGGAKDGRAGVLMRKATMMYFMSAF